MDKKGQVALYIIISIIILIVVAVVMYARGEFLRSLFGLEEKIIIPPQLKIITDTIQSCLERTGRDSIYNVGRGGGYNVVPETISIIWFSESIPYYYLNNTILTPSDVIFERELNNYIKGNAGSCLDFTDFRKEGFNISNKSYSINATINDKTVDVVMNYPIKISKGDVSVDLKTFEVIINSNLKNLHSAAIDSIINYAKNPGFVCLTCIEDTADKYNVSITTIPHLDPSLAENDIIWFLIDDKEFQIDESRNLTLRFVVEQ